MLQRRVSLYTQLLSSKSDKADQR